MNAQIQAIQSALSVEGSDDRLHDLLVVYSQKLRQTLDKITSCVSDRESKYDHIKLLQIEMSSAMDDMLDADGEDHRPVSKIAAELKRVNDSLDKDIDKVYDLISDANALRDTVTDLTMKIADIPLVSTAA